MEGNKGGHAQSSLLPHTPSDVPHFSVSVSIVRHHRLITPNSFIHSFINNNDDDDDDDDDDNHNGNKYSSNANHILLHANARRRRKEEEEKEKKGFQMSFLVVFS